MSLLIVLIQPVCIGKIDITIVKIHSKIYSVGDKHCDRLLFRICKYLNQPI